MADKHDTATIFLFRGTQGKISPRVNHFLLLAQPQIRFVDEGRRLQCLPRLLLGKFCRRQLP